MSDGVEREGLRSRTPCRGREYEDADGAGVGSKIAIQIFNTRMGQRVVKNLFQTNDYLNISRAKPGEKVGLLI